MSRHRCRHRKQVLSNFDSNSLPRPFSLVRSSRLLLEAHEMPCFRLVTCARVSSLNRHECFHAPGNDPLVLAPWPFEADLVCLRLALLSTDKPFSRGRNSLSDMQRLGSIDLCPTVQMYLSPSHVPLRITALVSPHYVCQHAVRSQILQAATGLSWVCEASISAWYGHDVVWLIVHASTGRLESDQERLT
ncbi:hypothetical protein BD309DRAFT_596350 [Dichomitus squalens]|nr:hypothetical protein BD309DRAFT_596350 [Dichomitus squalens]